MSKDKQPEGYCAWHPEHGYMLATIAHDPTHTEAIFYDQVGAAEIENSDEWILKPVYFHTEPPVSKEVWGEIERLLDMLCDLKTWPEARWLIEKAWEIREAILPKQPKGEK